MPEKKEPGQIAYEAMLYATPSWRGCEWFRQGDNTRTLWAAVEAAVLAAHKPARAAGVWITDAHDLSRRFIVASKAVEQVVIPSPKTPAAKFWVNFDGACSIAVYEADARKVVEALGGTWPEPQPAPEVKP